MTEKEKKRMLEKAEKLVPKPVLLSSGSWRCQVYVDGKRRSVTGKTPEAAHAAALALRAGYIDKKERGQTLADAMQDYIENRRNVLSPATVKSYINIQENYFLDLHKTLVSDISEEYIQKEINKCAANKSPKTVKNAVSFLIAVVSLDHNINVKRLKYPAKPKKEHAFLEGSDIARLIDACKGDPVEIPVLFALWLGLRRSEICALEWEDIDFTAQTVSVTKALVPNSNNEFVIKQTTKTEGSQRVLPCPNYIISRLMDIEPDSAKRTGRIVSMYPNDIYNRLKVLCDRNNIPFVGVHGLRHTNASIMLSLNISEKIAMARGGWTSNRTMQSIYQHIFQEDMKSADETIEVYFRNLQGKTAHEIAHEK